MIRSTRVLAAAGIIRSRSIASGSAPCALNRVSDFSKGDLASCGEDDDSEVAGELRA